MKKLTSILLALVMALTLCSTAFAEGEATMLPAAVDGVITLTENITVTNNGQSFGDNNGVINFTSDVVLDGANKTITAGDDFVKDSKNHIINVTGGTVTIKNLTIVGNANTKHGINVFGADTKVILENVTIKNCGTAAIVVNQGELTATGLTTSGNVWGAINVDNGGKLTLDTTNNLSELGKVWSESDSNSTVDIKDAKYSSVSGDKYCYSSNAADLGVAAIDKTVYATLTAAVTAATKGATITLVNDVKDTGAISLPANVTLDGDGKTISGNSSVYINAAGGTVKNVIFKDIHNTSNTLSPVYATGEFTGKAVITGCTFLGSDWDSIQATPKANAVIEITNNTFTSTSGAKRYVHIEAVGEKTEGKWSVDFSATVTGNNFLNVKNLKETGLEVYWAKDAKKLNLSGNYMDAPMAVCIGVGGNYDDYNNSYFLSFPFVDKDGKNKITPVATINNSAGTKLYLTMAEALADTTVSTYYVYGNVTEDITVSRDVTLDMGTKNSLTGAVTVAADKTLTVKNGTLTITGGTFSGKLAVDKGDVVVTGGTFAFNPAEYVHDSNYVVTKVANDKYTVAASTGTSSVVLPTGSVGGSMGSLVNTVITADDVDANKELVVTDGNNVSVTLNTTAVGEVAENGELSLSVTTNTASTSVVEDANKDAYNKVTKGSNAVIVSINLRSDNSNVFTEEKDGAYAIVTVPYKANMKSVTVKHLDANGQVNDLTAANSANLTQNNTFYYDSTTGDITMRLPHFSQYLINGSVSTGYVNRHNSGAVTTDKAESPKTFDAGIAVYGVMAISSIMGMGYVGKKKF